MAKKSFRRQPEKGPSYPRLVDLQPGFLRRWGLVAAGGLLIGVGACRKHPEPTAGVAMPERLNEELLRQAHAALKVDAGAPALPPTILPPGEPPMARVESKTATQTKTAVESGSAVGKKAKKHTDRPRLRGGPPKQRRDP